MVELVASLFLVAMVAGVGCVGLGYVSYKRYTSPGATAFGVFLAVWGAIPTVMYVAGGVIEALYAVGQIFLWSLATLAWFLFALRYTGNATRVRPAVTAAMAVPSVVVIPWLWGPLAGGESAVLEAVASLTLTYFAALALIGGVLLIRVARTYGHLSVGHGVVLAATGIVPTVTNTLFGIVVDRTGTTRLSAVLFAVGFLAVLLASAAALFRFDVFGTTLAAGAVGERAVVRETEDLVVIVDDDDRVLKLNEAARERLSGGEEPPLGARLPAVAEHDTGTLAASDTVELPTDGGVRTFDPRVTALTDQHGRRLGSMVSLRDVTDREIRRQRLAVLNRVLRHNLRNQVGVIEAHTEVVAEEVDGELREHLDAAAESADSLAALGRKAKDAEDLLDRDRSTVEIHLGEFAEEMRADATERWPSATVSLDRAPDATVTGDRAAAAFVVETLVETVIDGASGESPAVELSVECGDAGDRYPVLIEVAGEDATIPVQDVQAVRERTETPLQHGLGVGLWVANWAVTDLGGELAVDTAEGAVVRVGLPFEPDTPE
jgi:PAS domain-containing protein/two-component sensor histidine kinase